MSSDLQIPAFSEKSGSCLFLQTGEKVMTNMEMLAGKKSTYRIIRKLGSGGMCNVYLAADNINGNHVAIKKLRDDKKDFYGEKIREQLLREISILKRITYDADDFRKGLSGTDISAVKGEILCGFPGILDQGHDFYVMELVKGDCLADIISKDDRSKEPGPDEIRRMLIGLCSILIRLHELNPPVLHLDIKPSNVLITDGNIPCLIDFGSAMEIKGYSDDRPLENMPGSGTAFYAAPEQYGSLFTTDRRTDIYQLGKLIQRMLERSRIDYFYKKELLEIAGKCTKGRSLERYGSVRDVLENVLKSDGRALKRRGLFWMKAFLGAACFWTAAITIPLFIKAAAVGTINEPSVFLIPALSVIIGHFIWNDDTVPDFLNYMIFQRPSGGIKGVKSKKEPIFIDIVMTCDTIDI